MLITGAIRGKAAMMHDRSKTRFQGGTSGSHCLWLDGAATARDPPLCCLQHRPRVRAALLSTPGFALVFKPKIINASELLQTVGKRYNRNE